ncbi:hypothetical protein MSHOH_2032 [Methanosarcina horonobensis HB-1 = JCM 15518]|uniref:Uncharacterized protein n=1 Tax=Methanosarcina horonobensis HB-1 = JCM 15518 TaxID=1434110 RepID=A0A0E3WUQ5_9EURY|nr:hypothetical protein [Methanosarcina horonobensis]AKB78515.1 hypothetical protein MSHOH_2032 [Methanosarcina horonobensis HB-1 = JCM 15518]
MISHNPHFVTVTAQQNDESIVLSETKRAIKSLDNKERTFELFEEIFKLGKTEDLVLYPIMFLQTSDASKPGIGRLIITTARKFYKPSEHIVAIAVKYRLSGVFRDEGLKYLRSRILETKDLHFVGAFHKKFEDSPCTIQVCTMTEKMWNDYCDSVHTDSKDNFGNTGFSPLLLV